MALIFDWKKRYINFSKGTKWKNSIDITLWLIPCGLVILSGILIASTQRKLDYADWYQHWITALIGFGLAFVISQLSLEKIRPLLMPIYWLTIISLLAVKFVGTSALGAQRWLSFAGFNFQPSEFAKLSVQRHK